MDIQGKGVKKFRLKYFVIRGGEFLGVFYTSQVKVIVDIKKCLATGSFRF